MAWFISPSVLSQNSGVIDFYLGRRIVTVQTTETDTGYAFVQRLNGNLSFDSVVLDSIVFVPLNGNVLLDFSNYPAGYYRVVAGASFTPSNYTSQSGPGDVSTPSLPVIYKTSIMDAYTLPSSPPFTVSFPLFPCLQFSWKSQDSSYTFKVEWREVGTLEFISFDNLTGDFYLASPFEYDTQYELRLFAKSSLTGEYSLPTCLTITYPLDTLATPNAIVTPSVSFFSIEYEAIPNATHYCIKYKLHAALDAWINHVTTDTQFTINNLESFEEYDIQVIAQADGYIDSSPYTFLSSTLGTLPVIIPFLEKQYPLINIGIWDPIHFSAFQVFYEIRYNTVNDFDSSILFDTTSSPSFIHRTPAPDFTFFYWIRPVAFLGGDSLAGEWATGIIAGNLSVIPPMSYRIHLDVTDYPETTSEIPFSLEVDWGDGLTSQYADLSTMPELTHEYSASGTYFIVFSLTNNCGTTRTRTEVTLIAGYADNPANTFEKSTKLTIFDISASDTIDDNIPPIEIVGEVRQFLLETGEYGYETTITSSLELIQFPSVHELIPIDQLLLGNDSGSNMTDHCTEHLEYAVSEPFSLGNFASIVADVSFSLVFNYVDLLTDVQLYFNTYDVIIRADAEFFVRCSCLGLPIIDPIDNTDGTFTGTISFDGKHLAGFQLEIASGPFSKLYQVDINILQSDGSVSRISNNVLDLYAVSFITNKHSLFDVNSKTHSTISGASEGYLPIISTFEIDHVELTCDSAIKERILFDSFRIVGNRYLLTIRNTGTNPQKIDIPIATGRIGKIFHIQAFTLVPPDITNLPIVFRPDINARRTHNTYFYQAGASLVSQDTFLTPVFPFVGTGTLQTLYGTVTFSFYDKLIFSTPYFTQNTPALTASGELNADYAKWRAFGLYPTGGEDCWAPASATVPAWLQIDCEQPVHLAYYYLTSRPNPLYAVSQSPKDFMVLGSNDDTNWAVIDTRVDVVWPSENYTHTFDTYHNTPYRYYRIHITATGELGAHPTIGKWRLFVYN